MSDVVYNLDEPCNFEGCDVGSIADNTMRQWAKHGSTPRDKLEYAPIPDDIQQVIKNKITGLDDYIIADGMICKAAVADMHSGPMGVSMPILIFEFNIGRPGEIPLEVAKIAFLGTPEQMRTTARLVGDTARGAANAVEKKG